MSAFELLRGDCVELMAALQEASVDAIVTDPPYALTAVSRKGSPSTFVNNPYGRARVGTKEHTAVGGFMGKTWDAELPGVEVWAAALRVLKPGGHVLAFGGTRTFHRLACAIEDAGFEIRDCLSWLYGSGFPKSHNIGGGRGTALKPAWEPVVLARKALVGTVAGNVQAHGTGALNVDDCRIGTSKDVPASRPKRGGQFPTGGWKGTPEGASGHDPDLGRWPANVALDEAAAEVLDDQAGERVSGANPTRRGSDKFRDTYNRFPGQRECTPARGEDRGGASRFFYTAKADAGERHYAGRNVHPTVKPVALMRWLCRLVTPPGGLVLDPFMGSGSTGVAALAEGFRFLGMEREAEYVELARRRIAGPLFAESGA